jgi:hypothetical protein
MFYRRFQKLTIVVLLLLYTSATSFAATVIYAQNVNGLICKSTDAAKTWQQLPPMPSAAVADAALAVDPQNTNNLHSIYDAGKLPPGSTARQGVFRSTDGGQTWAETLTQAAPPIVVDATASNIICIRYQRRQKRPVPEHGLRRHVGSLHGRNDRRSGNRSQEQQRSICRRL